MFKPENEFQIPYTHPSLEKDWTEFVQTGDPLTYLKFSHKRRHVFQKEVNKFDEKFFGMGQE